MLIQYLKLSLELVKNKKSVNHSFLYYFSEISDPEIKTFTKRQSRSILQF